MNKQIENHSNLSGYKRVLISVTLESEDDPDERFLISGETMANNPVGILNGLRFLERLWRGNVPFVVAWAPGLDVSGFHRMCKDIYQPQLYRWTEVLESDKTLWFAMNLMAMEILPVNPYGEAIDSREVLEWREEHNLYLFVYAGEADEN